MLKNKSLLYGLGSGLIIGAILLQLMLAGTSAGGSGSPDGEQDPPLGSAEVEALKREAALLGYRLLSEAELQQMMEQAVQPHQSEADRLEREYGELSAAYEEQRNLRSFYITPRMDAQSVVDMMVQLGIIADQRGFESMLRQRELTTRLQVGYYTFAQNADPVQVLEEITGIR